MVSSDARTNGATNGTSAVAHREPTAALIAVVEDLAGELSLRPLLERILRRSTELLGCDAGSICLVDEAAGVYRKEADIGVACQSGRIFPLDEGVTGAVFAARGLVIFDEYAKVPGGHVREEDRASLKGVIGVPIWWRGHNSVTRTMGMALTSCTPPAKGSPLFDLGDDEMEMAWASTVSPAVVGRSWRTRTRSSTSWWRRRHRTCRSRRATTSRS